MTPKDQSPAAEDAGDLSRRQGVDWTSWLLVGLLGVIWGGSFALVGVAVDSLPPLTVAAARLSIAALLLTPLAYVLGDGLPSPLKRENRRFWLHAAGAAAAANAIPFSLLSWAQILTPSGLAGVFMATVPLIVLPLAARFVPGEPMTWRRTLGFVIGFVGVVLLIGPEALGRLGGGGWEILAQIACLGAATGYAVGSIITKLAPKAHPISFSAAVIGLAALMMAPPTLALERPFDVAWSQDAALAVIFLGVFPTAAAAVLLFVVLARQGPGFLAMVNYQVPVWAMLFGVLLLGEVMPPQTPIVLGLILLGVAIAQGRLRPPRLW